MDSDNVNIKVLDRDGTLLFDAFFKEQFSDYNEDIRKKIKNLVNTQLGIRNIYPHGVRIIVNIKEEI